MGEVVNKNDVVFELSVNGIGEVHILEKIICKGAEETSVD